MITTNDIIYFVLTDRFFDGNPDNNCNVDLTNPTAYHGGDFDGLAAKIPYFKKLGVTAIWITPVYLNIHDLGNSAGYHGYWTIDFEKIDPHLFTPIAGRPEGSREYLADLVRAFHDNGLKVILDMVVNHTGYHTESYQSYPNKVFDESHFNYGEGSIKGQLAGLPDLDHDQIYVVDYFINNILAWIEDTGIDGIRMDTVKHVEDKFWYFFKSTVKIRHPHITLIGEVLDWDAGFVSHYQREHDFDSVFDFPLCGAIKGCLVWDQPMTMLARPRIHPNEQRGALDNDKIYTNAARLVTLLDNHDLDRRIMSEILDRVHHWDRDLAREIMKLCMTFLLTTRGIPQIYYGTEIGMTGYQDPDNRHDMPWHLFDQDHNPIPAYEKEIFNHVRRLITIRKNNPAITSGYLITLYCDIYVYAFMRIFKDNIVIVVINNGLHPMPVALPIQVRANTNIPGRIKKLFVDGYMVKSLLESHPDVPADNGSLRVQLGRKSAALFAMNSDN